jgi:O-antigen/teichoic acid export membrane protein
MKTISNFLLSEKNIGKATFTWNAFAAMMNSFQTTVLAIALTRSGSAIDSSIFFIAYAIANLMMNIGKYGIRQFQVTDVREKYKYREYVIARYVTLILMFAVSFIYIFYNVSYNGYTKKKAAVVFLICLFKAVEAFEDVLHGRMQQKGRLDTASRILGIRLFVYLILFTCIYLLTGNLVLTTVINLGITVILSLFLNGSVRQIFCKSEKADVSNVKEILVECFPLCISTCLNMYVANAPKYIIDTVVSDETQSAFNIVFMPVFVIALLGTFIFQPSLIRFGEIWDKKDIKKFRKLIAKLTAFTTGVAFAVIFIGSFAGIPVLELVYGVNLNDYKSELIIFMIAGGLIAIQNLFIMVITTVRYQKYLIWGYAAVTLILLIAGKKILAVNGLMALSVFFVGMLALLTIYFFLLISISFSRVNVNRKKGERNVRG